MTNENMQPVAGSETLTRYGWGVVKELRDEDSSICVCLEWGANLYCREVDLLSISLPIGTCVDSKYGTGIILDYLRAKEMYIVRIWQADGSQGAAMAYMPRSDIIRVVVAAVGLQVLTPLGVQGRVLSYRRADNMYMVQLPFATAFIPGSHLQCPVSKFIPTSHYLVWLASNNISPRRGLLMILVDVLRKVRSGDVHMDISIEGVVKLLLSSNATSTFLVSQRSQFVTSIKNVKTRMMDLAKSNGIEFGSDFDLQNFVDQTNLEGKMKLLGNDAFLIRRALQQIDDVITSLETGAPEEGSGGSLVRNAMTSSTGLGELQEECEAGSGNKKESNDMTDLSRFIKLYLGDSGFNVDLLAKFMSFVQGNAEVELRSIGFLSSDATFSATIGTLRDISSVWLNTMKDLQKIAQTILYVVSASKSFTILNYGGQNLKTRIMNLVAKDNVSTDLAANQTKELLHSLPALFEHKIKSEAAVKAKSRVLSIVTASNNIEVMSSFFDSILTKVLSNWGDIRNSAYETFKSNQFVVIALLQSLENCAESAVSKSWRVNAEARLCSLLKDGIIHDHKTLNSFEIRKKFITNINYKL